MIQSNWLNHFCVFFNTMKAILIKDLSVFVWTLMARAKYFLSLVCIFYTTIWASFALTDPAIKYPWLDLYYESPKLVWQTPSWFSPHTLDSAPEDFSYRQGVLPYAEYRNEDLYLVIPQLGLITPIVQIPKGSNDEALMTNGQNIDINKYLNTWIIEYVQSPKPWYQWKRIDFGHSNFFADGEWDFKTIFANLMRLDAWDQVWYYQKNQYWSYELFKYRVTSSYPTDPSNVEALRWDGNGADALIFGCYHWLDGRRMVEATYLWEVQWAQQPVDPFPLVSTILKQRIDSAIMKIRYVWINERKVIIIWLRNSLDKLKNTATTQEALQIIEYTMRSLLLVYPS